MSLERMALLCAAIGAGWIGLSLLAGWLASRWFRFNREEPPR